MKDKELQELKIMVKDGWPNKKQSVNDIIKPYWNYRDVITEVDGILFKSNQLIIPQSMKKEILQKLHYSHLGINKTISKARETVFWPYMSKEIGDMIQNCITCLEYQNSQQQENLANREVADVSHVWSIKIHNNKKI
ncbi:Integrase zinc binding domain [Popillia japonica]|uniref:RNA-directed DNA polymerase n=1 Tax=Popillia japonica TaxID=7064 RepID=A0AAW1IFI8_POPJA